MRRLTGIKAAMVGIIVAVVSVLVAPAARSNCDLPSQPVFHGIGGRFVSCAEGPGLEGRIYLVSDHSVSTVFQVGHPNAGLPMEVLCEKQGGSTDAGGPWQMNAGNSNDEIVAVQFDWGAGSDAEGCPNPTGWGDGTTPLAVHVVDNNGDELTAVIGFSSAFAGFLVEAAQPNSGSNTALDIGCRDVATGNPRPGSPSLNNVTDIHTMLRVIDLTVMPPSASGVFSDCDSGSLGLTTTSFPSTCGPVRSAPRRGNVYTKIDLCTAVRDGAFRTLSNGWVSANPSVPDPDTGQLAISTNPAELTGVCDVGPNVCLSPALATGHSCMQNSDCDRDVCRWIGNTQLFPDAFEPPVGLAVVYWITGNQQSNESSLGTDSSGNVRPNDNPCP